MSSPLTQKIIITTTTTTPPRLEATPTNITMETVVGACTMLAR
jgi:hypothetical protein